MFKKSFTVASIQIMGSLLGLLSLYLIAGDMEPAVYSLVGVYAVISQIVCTFSNLGLETTMMREALLWEQQGDFRRNKEYTTQALLSRIIAFLFQLPLLLVYVMVLNFTKYDGQYALLLIMILFGSLANALNNAMSLIVRAEGGYVFSQLTSVVNSYAIKIAGIGIYYWIGATGYLYFYALSSVPLTFVYLIKLRHRIDRNALDLKSMIEKAKEAKYLTIRSYLDYIKTNADSMLVSMIFPPVVMGAYSIFKQLEQIARGFIEGFFDVLSQNTVKYKGNVVVLKGQEKKIKWARNIIIIVLFIGLGVFMCAPQFWISLVRLNKYESMELMIICVVITSVLYLLGKYEINALAFFATSKMNLLLGIIVFAISVISFVFVLLIPNISGVLMQRILVYLGQSLVAIIIFKSKREELYTKINK